MGFRMGSPRELYERKGAFAEMVAHGGEAEELIKAFWGMMKIARRGFLEHPLPMIERLIEFAIHIGT